MLSRYSGELKRNWATLACWPSPASSSAAATPSARWSKSRHDVMRAVAVERRRVREAVGHRLPHVGVGPALRRAHLRRRPFESSIACRAIVADDRPATGVRGGRRLVRSALAAEMPRTGACDVERGARARRGSPSRDLRRSEDFWTRVVGMERQAKLRLPEMDEVILGFHAKGASLVADAVHRRAGRERAGPAGEGRRVGRRSRRRSPRRSGPRACRSSASPSRSPSWATLIVGFAADPDGYRIEILQRPPRPS